MKGKSNKHGMTLVEMLLTVAIIAMLSAFLIPAISRAIRGRENAECARKLLLAVQAFEMYASESGNYPAENAPGAIPPEMEPYYFPYFKIDWWDAATELGGSWDWNNGGDFTLSVALSAPARPAGQLTEFDRLVDDGYLDTGKFRQAGNRYHYIIEE
jgi:prepilin-type N-terminal cleavage/methylation domain-containing protein